MIEGFKCLELVLVFHCEKKTPATLGLFAKGGSNTSESRLVRRYSVREYFGNWRECFLSHGHYLLMKHLKVIWAQSHGRLIKKFDASSQRCVTDRHPRSRNENRERQLHTAPKHTHLHTPTHTHTGQSLNVDYKIVAVIFLSFTNTSGKQQVFSATTLHMIDLVGCDRSSLREIMSHATIFKCKTNQHIFLNANLVFLLRVTHS